MLDKEGVQIVLSPPQPPASYEWSVAVAGSGD